MYLSMRESRLLYSNIILFLEHHTPITLSIFLKAYTGYRMEGLWLQCNP